MYNTGTLYTTSSDRNNILTMSLNREYIIKIEGIEIPVT